MSVKILMIGWEYPPKNSGGLGVACRGIVEHLVEDGFEVLMVLPQQMQSEEVVNGELQTKTGRKYKVIFVKSQLRPYASVESDKYQGDIVSDVYEYANKIVSAVANESFDLIHIHDWLTVPAGIALKEASKKPLIMHVHSTEFDRTAGGAEYEAVAKVEQEGFAKSDKLICVSNYTKELLIKKYGVLEGKIRVMHNGVDPISDSEMSTDFLGDSPVVLFVGRLTIQKGPEYFIDVAKRVTQVHPETIFVFAGDGDMFSKLIESTAYHELTASVIFAGFLRGKTKDRLYQRADIFVMPSVSEPFGIVALEAAQRAKPIILSKTSGVAEVLPSAIAVDFWDTELTARKINELIDDKQHSEFLGQNLRREASELTWGRTVRTLTQIYQEVLQNG